MHNLEPRSSPDHARRSLPPPTGTTDERALLRVLGATRASLVEHLAAHPASTTAELAGVAGSSATAVRKHLERLRADELVDSATSTPDGPGRPATRWSLTEKGHRLLPDGHAALANEAMAFLGDTQGREGVRAFLRWRMDRQADALADAVGDGDLRERLHALADALSDAGFEARVEATDDGWALVQTHCTVQGVASEHPSLCAYEAATFKRVLGDAAVSRRTTIAAGDQACVCNVAAG